MKNKKRFNKKIKKLIFWDLDSIKIYFFFAENKFILKIFFFFIIEIF
jgi:hypothetical protein